MGNMWIHELNQVKHVKPRVGNDSFEDHKMKVKSNNDFIV